MEAPLEGPINVNTGCGQVPSQAAVLTRIESWNSDARCEVAQEANQHHSAFVVAPGSITPSQIASGFATYSLCIGGFPTQGFTIGALKRAANVDGFITLPVRDHLF